MRPVLALLLGLLVCSGLGIPKFEVYWESRDSYNYNDDESNNPWYIDLGAIDVGAPGYIGGPNIVTIHAADYCVNWCQEQYHDEFCDKYPPEGVPALPRSVEDWGTKFNITANMMAEGIEKIHQAGGKVNLAYGGQYQGMGYGISAEAGGNYDYEDIRTHGQLARRIANNVEDWNLDGVDFFFSGPQEGWQWGASEYYHMHPGNNVIFHLAVIKSLRNMLPASKTISYTTNHNVDFTSDPDNFYGTQASVMEAVISACHPYLTWFSFNSETSLDDRNLDAMAALGIPVSKLGVVIVNQGVTDDNDHTSNEEMRVAVEKIKAHGLAGLSVFSINEEHRVFQGGWAKMVAEMLYLD